VGEEDEWNWFWITHSGRICWLCSFEAQRKDLKPEYKSGIVQEFSRNNQHNAQNCTNALFYMLASICFGSSLPSSGSFWIRLSYVQIQIDMVVYHILVMWLSGLCVGVSC
jgi:hypothetical protein